MTLARSNTMLLGAKNSLAPGGQPTPAAPDARTTTAHHSAVPPPPGSNHTGTRPLVQSTLATQQPQRPTSLWEFDLAQHREVITPRRDICTMFLNQRPTRGPYPLARMIPALQR